jgi:hypothetical protein
MATRDDWKHEPIEEPVPMTPPQTVWTNDEWAVIRGGLVPGSMDDRWFAYAEGDTVYMYRSWSGKGIYRARFERTADGSVIVEAVAARGHDDPQDLEMVVRILIRGPVDDGWESS